MTIINKSKKFFLEVRVNSDPATDPDVPSLPVGTMILWNDGGTEKQFFKTSSGVSEVGASSGGGGGSLNVVSSPAVTQTVSGSGIDVPNLNVNITLSGGRPVVLALMASTLAIDSFLRQDNSGGVPNLEFRTQIFRTDSLPTTIGLGYQRFLKEDAGLGIAQTIPAGLMWFDNPPTPDTYNYKVVHTDLSGGPVRYRNLRLLAMEL